MRRANILHTRHYLIPKQPHNTAIIPINCGSDLLKRPGYGNIWQNQDLDTDLTPIAVIFSFPKFGNSLLSTVLNRWKVLNKTSSLTITMTNT